MTFIITLTASKTRLPTLSSLEKKGKTSLHFLFFLSHQINRYALTYYINWLTAKLTHCAKPALADPSQRTKCCLRLRNSHFKHSMEIQMTSKCASSISVPLNWPTEVTNDSRIDFGLLFFCFGFHLLFLLSRPFQSFHFSCLQVT